MFEVHICDSKTADKYVISPMVSHNGTMTFWICNRDGEGMEVMEIDLFDVIGKFFIEKF